MYLITCGLYFETTILYFENESIQMVHATFFCLKRVFSQTCWQSLKIEIWNMLYNKMPIDYRRLLQSARVISHNYGITRTPCVPGR